MTAYREAVVRNAAVREKAHGGKGTLYCHSLVLMFHGYTSSIVQGNLDRLVWKVRGAHILLEVGNPGKLKLFLN